MDCLEVILFCIVFEECVGKALTFHNSYEPRRLQSIIMGDWLRNKDDALIPPMITRTRLVIPCRLCSPLGPER
jgi:hypothetical protein